MTDYMLGRLSIGIACMQERTPGAAVSVIIYRDTLGMGVLLPNAV